MSNFENRNFSIFISDLESLQKSMIVNWFSFFYILIVSASKLEKTVNYQLDVLLFSNFDVFLDFKDVNIEIWKTFFLGLVFNFEPETSRSERFLKNWGSLWGH